MKKVYSEDDYDSYSAAMLEKFPLMFTGRWGGFDVGPGWWPIIESLCFNIQSHIDSRNSARQVLLASNPYNIKIPDEVEQVVVTQIKEKFGGLRFYYVGGDVIIDGMVRMAESWAGNTCETCGHPGEIRMGRWIRTLCDVHETQYQEKANAATV